MDKKLKYFGTDGIRGVVGVSLTEDIAVKIGLGLRYALGMSAKRPRVLVGKDTRISSGMLESALVSGLLSSGVDVYLLGCVTTPAVSLLVRDGFDAGVMITASHNPYTDNGLKIFTPSGEKTDFDAELAIEKYIDSECIVNRATGADVGRTVFARRRLEIYRRFLLSNIDVDCSGIRVGVDSANGGAFRLLGEILASSGAEIHRIGASPNGVNINDGCGATHTERLAKLVTDRGLDIGFALDGDGDRCIAVDRFGNVLDGDKIICTLGADMMARGELRGNKVAVTIMSGVGLLPKLDSLGILAVVTGVGDRCVADAMKKEGLSLGAERSGHIIFGDILDTGDGILSAIKILSVMRRRNISSDMIGEGYVPFPMVNENLKYDEKHSPLCRPDFLSVKEKAEKMLGDGGRLIVRKSGTEPLLRVSAEGKSEELCRSAIAMILNYIRNGY